MPEKPLPSPTTGDEVVERRKGEAVAGAGVSAGVPNVPTTTTTTTTTSESPVSAPDAHHTSESDVPGPPEVAVSSGSKHGGESPVVSSEVVEQRAEMETRQFETS